MKKMKIAGLILLSLIIGTKSFGQTASTEQLTVPLSSPGKPYSLKVHLVSGSIKVASYEGKDVIINVIPRNGNNEDESNAVENGMKRISTHGSYEVTAKEADNNVTGELEVNNVNDKITLTNISGSVVANTVNGDVNVTFKTVDPKAPMSFSTLNGDVNVTLPADTKANLKLKSDNGDVFSDFDIDIDKTPAKIDKTTEPGLYKIKKDDWVSGKINGGGPEMMMKNMQGNIYVKKGTK